MTDDDTEQTLAKCTMCLNWMEPFNPVAEAHICRDCLEDIQVGDRYDDTDTNR